MDETSLDTGEVKTNRIEEVKKALESVTISTKTRNFEATKHRITNLSDYDRTKEDSEIKAADTKKFAEKVILECESSLKESGDFRNVDVPVFPFYVHDVAERLVVNRLRKGDVEIRQKDLVWFPSQLDGLFFRRSESKIGSSVESKYFLTGSLPEDVRDSLASFSK